MSGLKLPLILLLLVIALFVWIMVAGSKKNNSAKASGDNPSDAQNFNADDYPAVQSLGSLLGAFSPKLNAKQILPSLTSYNLQTQSSYTLTVASDSKNKFRNAKFRMPTSTTKRCAHLDYKSAQPPAKELDKMKDQDSENLGKSDQAHPKAEITLTILSSGGTITINRNSGFSGQPCIVQLEQ